MRAYTDSGKLGGVLVAVARRGKLAYLETFGAADIEQRTPLSGEAVFRIYSMTKPVTAVAVLQLVERGKLRLDEPVSAYVPAFAHARVYAGGGTARPATTLPARPITIRDLLAHTSGLAYGLGAMPSDSLVRAFDPFRASRTLAGFADSLARIPLAFSPGERWSYGPGSRCSAASWRSSPAGHSTATSRRRSSVRSGCGALPSASRRRCAPGW
jgi:CubicO group peptidase (beta-lactamase class C family)